MVFLFFPHRFLSGTETIIKGLTPRCWFFLSWTNRKRNWIPYVRTLKNNEPPTKLNNWNICVCKIGIWPDFRFVLCIYFTFNDYFVYVCNGLYAFSLYYLFLRTFTSPVTMCEWEMWCSEEMHGWRALREKKTTTATTNNK